jgi:CRP/FNR family transcriptional regulator/CRP/FNR family cyclic AMP-dependent transcriptional regulator
MDVKDLEQLTSNVPLFANLEKLERDTITSILVKKSFKTDDMIVHEDDSENLSFFIIAEGSVHVTVFTSEGKQTILATLRKGEFFGEMALLDGEPRSASVIAAESCVLLMLYRRSFLEILRKYPAITIQMLVEMSRRLRRTNRQINTLSLMSVYGRVAEVILTLSKDSGKRFGKMIVIENRPTHQEIAEMAGTSRETVSRVISQLQKKQYISIDRKRMVILDEEKLYY